MGAQVAVRAGIVDAEERLFVAASTGHPPLRRAADDGIENQSKAGKGEDEGEPGEEAVGGTLPGAEGGLERDGNADDEGARTERREGVASAVEGSQGDPGGGEEGSEAGEFGGHQLSPEP